MIPQESMLAQRLEWLYGLDSEEIPAISFKAGSKSHQEKKTLRIVGKPR